MNKKQQSDASTNFVYNTKKIINIAHAQMMFDKFPDMLIAHPA